jgi:hypothetical protein
MKVYVLQKGIGRLKKGVRFVELNGVYRELLDSSTRNIFSKVIVENSDYFKDVDVKEDLLRKLKRLEKKVVALEMEIEILNGLCFDQLYGIGLNKSAILSGEGEELTREYVEANFKWVGLLNTGHRHLIIGSHEHFEASKVYSEAERYYGRWGGKPCDLPKSLKWLKDLPSEHQK